MVTDQPIAGTGLASGRRALPAQGGRHLRPDHAEKRRRCSATTSQRGASQDYKHIFFDPAVKQFEDDPYPGYPYGGNAYEWDNGDMKLVGILPERRTGAGGGGDAAADERDKDR